MPESDLPVLWADVVPTAAGRSAPLQDPLQAYLNSLAPASRVAVTKRLRAVARVIGVPDATMLPWPQLRFHHVEHIRSRLLEEQAAPATVNLTLAVLRGISRYARNFGLMTAEDYDRIRDVKLARGERLPAGRSIPSGELVALVEACAADPTVAGTRDAAILAVLYIGGVRRAELAALDLADYTADPPGLRIRHGKGNKERLLPLTGAASAALDAWVARRGKGPGALFVPLTKGGGLGQGHVTSDAIYKVLVKRAKEAHIAHLSPHDFRRTFVGDLLDAGVDLSTVQQLAGHASVTTTARYDRRGEATRRKAVEALRFPVPRPR